MRELISEVGPNGNVIAHAEDDDRVVYLYLRGKERGGLPTKAVWVRNRLPAPANLDIAGMEAGEPPLMPAPDCAHPLGAPALDARRLHLVWFPEGNGVALFEGEDLLAVVPPWAGIGGCAGYAKAAIGQARLAWSLDEATAIVDRCRAARAYWDEWGQEPGPWPAIQQRQSAALTAAFGPHRHYFALDGGTWPPRGMAWHQTPDAVVLATIGIALRPQPQVEQVVEDPSGLRRIELGFVLPLGLEDRLVKDVGAYVSAQSALPWRTYSWLGHGHSIPCDVTAPHGYPAVLLADARRLQPHLEVPSWAGDPVTMLWMVPVTAEELATARDQRSDVVLAGITLPRPWKARPTGGFLRRLFR
jgi:hypothetical protein